MFVTISLLLAAACLLPAAGKLTRQPKMRQSAAPRRADRPPACRGQRQGDDTGPGGPRDHRRLPGHRPHQLSTAGNYDPPVDRCPFPA
jgi:hypothetical protein